ncbi:hypothetical protein BD410DRAFT_787780 [Rickenella mellea]|uniref:Pinin/SDK/MemA protein domain-containing protein n=1 Tax=Rickenella mellea TaxID=50990 RepID=A0A4Y7Q6L7_9AGAM|nr:hypothetical protein BD410DRAFT_787780 [Rickenella mellea]
MSEAAESQVQQPPKEPAAMAANAKKRPRLDLGAAFGERKRGKSMFGVLVNTLNKAKAEDKERNASEAAKKRQLIEQRLQIKLRKETDSVRRAEEAKKDKITANRKEEDLQLKDSLHKLRRARIPQLSNFLLTSDVIREDDDADSSPLPSVSEAFPTRSHPPPLYYLPAHLTPAQEAFLNKRKAQFKEGADKEWEAFKVERQAGIEDISSLRQKVADEEERKRQEREAVQAAKDAEPTTISSVPEKPEGDHGDHTEARQAEMEIDDDASKDDRDVEQKKEDRMGSDEDDAVEY